MNQIKTLFSIFLQKPLSSFIYIFRTIRNRYLPSHAFFPKTITIHITAKCTYNCPMCINRLDMRDKCLNKELSTDEIKKFISSVAKYRHLISFCGGEPLLRKDIFEIISYTNSKGLLISMTTNGSMLRNKEYAEKLINSGIDFISPSYPDGEVSLCHGISYGNIKENKFIDIWNSEKAKEFRQMIKNSLTYACNRCCSIDIRF